MTQFLRVIAEMVLTLPWIFSNIYYSYILCVVSRYCCHDVIGPHVLQWLETTVVCNLQRENFARPPSQHITTPPKNDLRIHAHRVEDHLHCFCAHQRICPIWHLRLGTSCATEKRVQKVLGLEYWAFISSCIPTVWTLNSEYWSQSAEQESPRSIQRY